MVESMAAAAAASQKRMMKADEAIPPPLKVYPVACPAHLMMMMV